MKLIPRVKLIPRFNVTIRTSLLLIVAALIACLAGLGATSHQQIRGLAAQNTSLTTATMPSMKMLGDLKVASLRYRLALLQYVLTATDQDGAPFVAVMQRTEDEFGRLFQQYEAIIASDQERSTWKIFRTTWDAYIGQQKKIVTARNAGQTEAALMTFTATSKLFTTATSSLDQNILLNKRLADHEVETAVAGADTATVVVLAITGGSVVLALLAWLFVVTRVSRPLRTLTATMKRVAGGDTAVTVPSVGRADEIGEMARTLEVFRNGIVETERLRDEQAAKDTAIAERMAAERRRIADHFMQKMGGLAERFVRSSSDVAAAARNLSATAEQTTRQAVAVTEAAETASGNVQTVAAATEELNASVAEIDSRVHRSTEIAGSAADEAGRTEANIGVLTEAADKIGDVVNLIKDIASQTNLLALNATIEAARAGEAGRGFAVVASEVKLLAAQTAKATDEIALKIGEIQTATAETVSSIGRIVETIGSIREVTDSIATAVDHQGSATREIAVSITNAASGAAHVTENIAGVGRTAETTGAAASELLELSNDLSARSHDLTDEVRSFMESLRSA